MHYKIVDDALIESPYKFREKRLVLFSFLVLLLIAACSERTVFEYRDKNESCCKFGVPAGRTGADVTVHLITDRAGMFESAYPSLVLEYVTSVQDAGSVRKIDVNLATEHELVPTLFEIEAGYYDAFTTQKFPNSIPVSECCQGIHLKIRNEASTYQGDFGPVHFGIRIRKEYASIRSLPPEMNLIVTVETDKGVFKDARAVHLISYKSKGGVPFRFH
ncbi:MAG TPA: hypothetical protein PKE49_13965 [Leptospiraceae bacterium]|nr:hypothetical protein [Leptospirales bacterium]HMU84396.1 hypothetical protein [Leptospiraceae bacterium]HMW60655.1 hypothetical protein [Leptospiraceae bacterium]HMX57627.1 hypothetical protein [Leptospiraceae bacterium]HMZ37199.1 hypothetical protein [Leptospiraceae bacterium]